MSKAKPAIYAAGRLPNYGHPNQGHSTQTILSNRGRELTVISDESHTNRCSRRPAAPLKGGRSMHRTTMVFESSPSKPNYRTTVTEAFSGQKDGSAPRRPELCPSMHTSHFDVGTNDRFHSQTHYGRDFSKKETIAHDMLHKATVINKLNMNEAAEMKKVLERPDNVTNYRSQNSRIHNYLGYVLGPGVPREREVRHGYNVLTGEDLGPSWQEVNHRTSGNRVLYDPRRTTDQRRNTFTLG